MGVVFGMKSVVPHIKAAGGGWIVNVASMAGMNGFPYGGAYNATKLAVAGLSEGWSMELAPFDIHVAALCPGFVRTRIYLSDRVRPSDYDDSHRELIVSDDDLDPETMATGLSNEVKNGIDPISSRHASSSHCRRKIPIFSRTHRSETAFASVMR